MYTSRSIKVKTKNLTDIYPYTKVNMYPVYVYNPMVLYEGIPKNTKFTIMS